MCLANMIADYVADPPQNDWQDFDALFYTFNNGVMGRNSLGLYDIANKLKAIALPPNLSEITSSQDTEWIGLNLWNEDSFVNI